MKRSPIRRKKSAKQIAFDKELEAITPELMARAEGSCELMIPQICAGSHNLHRHHRRSRRVRKDGKANALSNLLLCCQPCHALVHRDRRWSKDHGFIIGTYEDPDTAHVNRSGRWMPR